MESNRKETFEFTYSAKRQEEIERIKSKYIPIEEDKMETLRKLDKSVERPGTIAGIVMGVVGALIMGTGMSFALVWTDTLLIPGIVIGIIGMVLMGIAFPVYKDITKKQREKLGPQILALSEELLK